MTDADDILLTNKSTDARIRDGELKTVKFGDAGLALPVDLNKVPRSEWDKYINSEIVRPEAIARYLDGRTTGLTVAESDNMELAIEKFYGIEAPYYIFTSEALRSHGRAWWFVPEAGKYLTGFILGKES